MLSFKNIEYLIALLLIVPLVFVFLNTLYWKNKTKKAIGDTRLVEALTRTFSPRLYRVKFILLVVAVAALVIAGANLRKPAPQDNEKRAGIDIMVALDVSRSMLGEDVKPSRLVKAKQLVSVLMDRLDNNRIGLVLFAGQAYLQMPLTSDIAAAKLFISNANPDVIPVQGTVISDALQVCNNSLDTKEKKYKAILLITDGEDHDTRIEQTLKQLYDNGVIVNSIGVGTQEGSTIIDPVTNEPKRDINGQTVITRLNETELKLIAEKTGGLYHRLDNTANVVTDVVQTIDGMNKKLISGEGSEKQYASLFPLFIALALLLLVGEVFVPEIKKNRL